MSSLNAPRPIHHCPKCDCPNKVEDLAGRDYRCSKCGVELAHVDITSSGVVRGIFGWLRSVGDIVSDRYRIKSVLGKGGFGVTYLVEDLRLNGKRRALKEVPELLFDEQETLLLSRLNHPAIPDIIDRSVSDGMVYFVLEFGGTRTLSDERRRLNGRIPFATLYPWMRQLCEVLTYLHGQSPPVIHRDLKPDNVLINDDNRIMLIDFGIAKENDPSTATRTLGRAVTHGFSPPEQVLGTGTDPRSDIYSLAATFYALVTGVTPPGAHERIAGKTLTPPMALAPDLPPTVDQALVRALNLNVNHRQQYVTEFSHALLQVENPQNEETDATVVLTSDTVDSNVSKARLKAPSRQATTDSEELVIEGRRQHKDYFALGLWIVVAVFVVGVALFLLRLGGGDTTEAPPAEPLRTTAEPTTTPGNAMQPEGTPRLPLEPEPTPVPLPSTNPDSQSEASDAPNRAPSPVPTPESEPTISQSSPTATVTPAEPTAVVTPAPTNAPTAVTGSTLRSRPRNHPAARRKARAPGGAEPQDSPAEPDWSSSMQRGGAQKAE